MTTPTSKAVFQFSGSDAQDSVSTHGSRGHGGATRGSRAPRRDTEAAIALGAERSSTYANSIIVGLGDRPISLRDLLMTDGSSHAIPPIVPLLQMNRMPRDRERRALVEEVLNQVMNILSEDPIGVFDE